MAKQHQGRQESELLDKLVDLAIADPEIEVIWLYGSRARGAASAESDYDLAVAYKSHIEDPIERRLRPELLAIDWQRRLGVRLSIIDINQAPLPLAYTVVADNHVLYCRNRFRQMEEERIILSKWELDHCYHKAHF